LRISYFGVRWSKEESARKRKEQPKKREEDHVVSKEKRALQKDPIVVSDFQDIKHPCIIYKWSSLVVLAKTRSMQRWVGDEDL
jgi:beta-lactamase regulating signal transducer with metallopeptidase domain